MSCPKLFCGSKFGSNIAYAVMQNIHFKPPLLPGSVVVVRCRSPDLAVIARRFARMNADDTDFRYSLLPDRYYPCCSAANSLPELLCRLHKNLRGPYFAASGLVAIASVCILAH